MKKLFILRDGNYYVENVNRGRNGKPIFCHHPLSAARMEAGEANRWAIELSKEWNITLEEVK